MFISKNLNTARRKLGLTLEEVSKHTDIGSSSLSEFENGKREPSLSQLQKLAQTYHRPLSFFFEESPAEEDVLMWRDKPSSPASDRIQVEFNKLCKQYHNLEIWTNTSTIDQLNKLFSDSFPSRYSEVEHLAHNTCNKMGLGERPGESLLRILEEVYGVKVFYLELSSETSSACTYSDKYGPAILLNRNNKPWRRNYDLAHELFHLVTWKVRTDEQGNWEVPGDKEESFADCFASRLLLPDEPFRDAIESVKQSDGKISYDDLDSVARQFGVSLDALFWRLGSLYRIPSDVIHRLINDVKHFSQLPVRLTDLPPDLPHRYRALAVRALNNGEISSAQFANYLGISISDVDDYTRSNVPDPIKISSSYT